MTSVWCVPKTPRTLRHCRDGKGGLCKIDSVKFKLPVELTAKAEAKSVTFKVSPK